MSDATALAEALIDAGRLFHGRGWSVGTSSNYSAVLGRDPFRLLVTASGLDKGRLTADDFVTVGSDADLLAPSPHKPSAETWLHVALAADPDVGSVLHTHSIWATILSDLAAERGCFGIDGYEMLKGLAGVTSHDHSETVAVFPNTQDIPDLARRVSAWRETPQGRAAHGFLIQRHGLYTWGRDVAEARRHVEIFEFLFEILGRRMSILPSGLTWIED